MLLRNSPTPNAPLPPGPGGLGIKRVMRMREDPLRFFSRIFDTYGDISRVRMAANHVVPVRDPHLIKLVLQDRNRDYDKGTRGYRVLARALGDGLLTAEGDSWLKNRRIAQPIFHKRRIAGFAGAMIDRTAETLDRWSDACARGERTLDVAEEMMALTMHIVLDTLFGLDVDVPTERVSHLMDVLQHYAIDATSSLLGLLPEFIPTPGRREIASALQELDAIVYGFIEKRRREGTGDDLLSMLMNARDEETGEGMSDTQLRDEALTMFLAGHETTANALAWTWYELSRTPHVWRQLRDEVQRVLGDRAPTMADLKELTYTRDVIRESMRLHPPAWTIARRAVKDDVLGGYRVEAGDFILMSPWAVHRHPDYWDNPEGFDPDRWQTPQVKALPRFGYFPFGGGPRLCIGKPFALMEASLIVAMITQRFRLDLAPGFPVVPEPLITLRPRHGIRMNLKPLGGDT